MNDLVGFILRLFGPNAWLPLLRHALTALGVWLAGQGWVDGAGWEQLVSAFLLAFSPLWSAKSATTPKVVPSANKTIKLSSLPPEVKSAVLDAIKS